MPIKAVRKLLLNHQASVKTRNLLIATLLILSSFLVLFSGITPVAAHDYDSYSYYKILSISNPNNDYQMKINITKTSGGDANCSGHCQDDFGDVAFADIDDNSSLDFWMEEYNSGTNAIFWVETPSDITSDTKIVLWYGTTGTTSTASDGDATFEFFDDFSGTSINSSRWANTIDTPDWSNDGSVVLNQDDQINTVDTFSPGLRIRMWAKCSEMDVEFIALSGTSGYDGNNRMTLSNTDYTSNDNTYDELAVECKEGGDNTDSVNSNIASDDIRYNCTYMAEWEDNAHFICYQNDSELADETSNVLTGSQKFYAKVWDSTQDCTLTIYWIFFSEYAATEPSWGTISSERPNSNASELGIISSYLSSGNILFSGQADTTVYCNETTGAGNNVTIYTSVNVSENCTDIYVDLSGDLTLGGSNQIDLDSSSGNSDIFLQASTSTWSGEWLQFTDANSYNLSLNTNWASISDDTNPFNITNSDGNTTIILRFRIDLGSGIAAGTYNSTSDSWKITHKTEDT